MVEKFKFKYLIEMELVQKSYKMTILETSYTVVLSEINFKKLSLILLKGIFIGIPHTS